MMRMWLVDWSDIKEAQNAPNLNRDVDNLYFWTSLIILRIGGQTRVEPLKVSWTKVTVSVLWKPMRR